MCVCVCVCVYKQTYLNVLTDITDRLLKSLILIDGYCYYDYLSSNTVS